MDRSFLVTWESTGINLKAAAGSSAAVTLSTLALVKITKMHMVGEVLIGSTDTRIKCSVAGLSDQELDKLGFYHLDHVFLPAFCLSSNSVLPVNPIPSP